MSNSLSGPKNLIYAVCIVLFALTGRAHAESSIDITLENDVKLARKEQKSNRSLSYSGNGQIDLTPRMNVVHKELIEHAKKILERYGTTFYALGRYLNAEGKLGSISPERSARLEPEAIAESLRESFRSGYLSKADVVGIAVDRPGSNKLLVDLEDATGICRSIEQEYESAPNGEIRFQGAKISTCAPKFFPAKDK